MSLSQVDDENSADCYVYRCCNHDKDDDERCIMMMNVRMMMMIEAAVSRSGWLPWLLQTPVRLPGSSQMPRAMMRRGGG